MSKQRKYFGTDGIRGRVGQTPITPEFALKLGWAVGLVLARQEKTDERAGVLIGKDTRLSGYLIEAALEAGLSAAGVDVYLTGPLPTPGVAYLTRTLRRSAGIVISASHNPFFDNGIKFFSAAGEKLPDAIDHHHKKRWPGNPPPGSAYCESAYSRHRPHSWSMYTCCPGHLP